MTTSQAFHRGTAQLFDLLTPDQTKRLAELQGDPGLADRLVELADRANEGELNRSERDEYEGYIQANDVLAVLQSEARFRLGGGRP